MIAKSRTVSVAVAVVAMLCASDAGDSPKQSLPIVQLTPADIQWTDGDNLAHGLKMAVLAGDPTKPGLYTARVKIPAGFKVQPHRHPEDRMVTVISGTFHFGYGEKFDESKLKELPPGSFFTEPAKQPHFAWAKSWEVILQVSAIGPTGTTPVEDDGR